MAEQLVEDAVILACKYNDTPFDQYRYLDSQVSIGAGRIDVLCYDGSAEKLLVVECKAGVADNWAVDQAVDYQKEIETEGFLAAFLTHSDSLKKDIAPTPRKYPVRTMVVAGGFTLAAHERALSTQTALYELHIDAGARVFREAVKGKAVSSTESTMKKFSSCYTETDWSNYLRPKMLRAEFDILCQGGKGISDTRKQWLVVQSKGQHLWVRYMGEAVLALFPKRQSLDVLFLGPEGNPENNRMIRLKEDSNVGTVVPTDAADAEDWARASEIILERIDFIDKQM